MSQNWRGVRRITAEPLIYQHQPACKPGSVGSCPLAQTRRDGHSSGTALARGLEQPTRTASLTPLPRALSLSRTSRVAIPIRSCSRWGLPCRFRCRTRGALLPHLFTLAASREGRSGSFSVALSLGLPPPEVIRHRMSMEPGLSSPFRERPSGRLTWSRHGVYGGLRQAVNGPERAPGIIIVKMSSGGRPLRLGSGNNADPKGAERCSIC
jgi:hypothetical protein